MISLGFTQLEADKHMCMKKNKKDKIIVSAHDADILMSCTSLKAREWFEKEISKAFEFVAQKGKVISYHGMVLEYDRNNKKIKLSHNGMITDLAKKHNCDQATRFPTTPSVPSLFEDPREYEYNPETDKREFQSLLKTLKHIGHYTHHEILLPVATLATRCAKPRKSDMIHALRIVRYLAGNRNIGPTFDGNAPSTPIIYADVSHRIHCTGHSHGGIIITLGSAPVYCMSYKLKLATHSASESELAVIAKASYYAVWFKRLLQEIDLMPNDDPIVVYHHKWSKKLLTRESFVKQCIE